MTVDYDLVVIGATPAARYAVRMAAQLKARVAWVTQQANDVNSGVGKSPPQWLENQEDSSLELIDWHSLGELAALGVDVIAGMGQFQRVGRRNIQFGVDQRILRARAYLLAIAAHPTPPAIAGLASVNYLHPDQIPGLQLDNFAPRHWLILGSDPSSVEQAQLLRRRGMDVTLITEQSRVLPAEDLEVVRLLQAQLEAEGIQLLTGCQVQRVYAEAGGVKIVLSQSARLARTPTAVLTIGADALVLATHRQPNLATLNLSAVGIVERPLLHLNRKLQTQNSCIYACGDVIGGYSYPHLAQYEAEIAVKNALFWPVFTVDYHRIPWAIRTDPPLARVGFTEVQARRRYGNRVVVLQQPFGYANLAQEGATTGLCKLIIRSNGEILGAHLIGQAAPELITTLALAVQQRLKIGAITALHPVSSRLSEILVQTAQTWYPQVLDRKPWLQEGLERFFYWRRSWAKMYPFKG